MATLTKNYLDLAGLQEYNGKIKEWGNSENQVAYKSVIKSADGNSLYFYKKANAVLGTDAPDATIALGGGDSDTKFNQLASKIGATWSGNTLNLTAFSEGIDATTIVGAINEIWEDMNAFVGEIPTGATAKTVVGYAQEVATAAETNAKAYTDSEIGKLDVNEFAIATVTNGIVNIKGVKEVDGKVSIGDEAGISLAKVASTGEAADVAFTSPSFTSTNVSEALNELSTSARQDVATKTVYMVASGSTADYAQVYDIYQGATGSSASPVASEKIGTINIPKDKVVESGSVKTVTVADQPYKGAKVGDKYIELILQNVANPLYIPANSLVDVYTGGTTAEATVTIDANNEITVTIVEINGSKLAAESVTKGKLATSVQDSLDLADSAVQSITEGATNGTINVDGTEVNVHGLGTAAFTDSSAYDAAGAAAAAVEALDTQSDVGVVSYNASTGAATFTGSIKEENGIIATGTANTVVIAPIANADIDSLFTE